MVFLVACSGGSPAVDGDAYAGTVSFGLYVRPDVAGIAVTINGIANAGTTAVYATYEDARMDDFVVESWYESVQPQKIAVSILELYGAASSWGPRSTESDIAVAVDGKSVGELRVRAPAGTIIDRVLRSANDGTSLVFTQPRRELTAVVEKAGEGGWISPEGTIGRIGRVAISERRSLGHHRVARGRVISAPRHPGSCCSSVAYT